MATQHNFLTPPRLRPALNASVPIAHRVRSRPDEPWCRVERQIFDDALADGANIQDAGRRAGRNTAQAERQFARICAELRDQAV